MDNLTANVESTKRNGQDTVICNYYNFSNSFLTNNKFTFLVTYVMKYEMFKKFTKQIVYPVGNAFSYHSVFFSVL